MKYFLILLLLLPIFVFSQNHILITEIVVTPTAGEFVEIYNNTTGQIDLTDYYLTDATYSGGGAYYYNIVTGTNAGGGSFGDFHARFPFGATIAAGEFQTIAVDGNGFVTTYGTQPNYELNGTDSNIPDMLEALSGSINGQGGITNSGEVMILYYWDGQSDLVQDIDYMVWGDKVEAVDKTGISIDGPDPDANSTSYLNDTSISQQISASSADPHSIGKSIQRLDLIENNEIQNGGNGINGNDETSEDLANSFQVDDPNPGSGPSSNNSPVISNITQLPLTPTQEDTVLITADVTDNGSIVSVKLFISIDSAPFDSTDMILQSGDSYESIIFPKASGSQVEYYIKALDNDGLASTSSIFTYTVLAGIAPSISNIIQIPGNPTSSDTVLITADVTDNDTVISAKLFISIAGSVFDSTEMNLQGGDTYQASILPQQTGTQVDYYLQGRDNDGLTTISTNYSYVVISGTSAGPHLLITEITVVPTAGEFVEIYNNTNSTIDLSSYYLTDATYASGNSFYYNIVTGLNAGGGDFGDFHAKFPSGASIASGEYQTIAMDGTGFVTTYGTQPTYELFDTDSNISDMLEALTGSINNQGGITNAGEVMILYYWDGQSDLVQDIDYVVWGDKVEAVDKTGVLIDGPDPGAVSTTYLNDTSVSQQISVSSADPHNFGESVQRLNFIENSEIQNGGNGITGHDETSEDLATSFQVGNPNPGSGPTSSNSPIISNINHQPSIPSPTDTVIVSADVTDNGTVTSVKLFTSINGAAFDSTDMSLESGNTFQSIILPQPNNTQVQYFIKAKDDEGLISTSTNYSYSVSTGGIFTSIANIQNNPGYIGQQVSIKGVVTLGAGVATTTWTDAYVQDSSGRGINIYQSGVIDPNLVRKNLVQITGTVDEYTGTTEIINYSVQVLSTNQSLPAPLQLTTNNASDLSYEGTYIVAQGVIVDKYTAGGGTTISIDDGSGSIDFRAWDTAGLSLDAYGIGDTVSIKGVMDIYQGVAQISLAYQDEIEYTTLEIFGDGSGIVTVSPDTVAAGDSLDFVFTITGNSTDTVTTMTLEIPNDWNWGGSVTLSGGALSNANTTVNGNLISISNAELKKNDQGQIEVFGLKAPDE
ncbi:lamin tail domain-containing protein, partial [Calditrichota bacterium]